MEAATLTADLVKAEEKLELERKKATEKLEAQRKESERTYERAVKDGQTKLPDLDGDLSKRL